MVGDFAYAVRRQATMIYTHVLNRGPGAIRCPVDHLLAP